MSDFGIYLSELKELAYTLVGVELSGYNDNSIRTPAECEYCEIEFMMRSCRNARQDIGRVLSLLRGYLINL